MRKLSVLLVVAALAIPAASLAKTPLPKTPKSTHHVLLAKNLGHCELLAAARPDDRVRFADGSPGATLLCERAWRNWQTRRV